ncbi:MAG: polymorphic toxin type 23 domain-containing protein [Bacteroidota bacterium]
MKMARCIEIFACPWLFVLLWSGHLCAQQNGQLEWGIEAGLSCQVGTRVNRIGAFCTAFANKNHWTWNAQWRLYYNVGRLGPPTQGFESQLSSGLSLGFGPVQTLPGHPPHALRARGQYRHRVGYALTWYVDPQSPQWTGAFAAGWGNWELILENDAFVFSGKDRFRTGALELATWLGDTRLASKWLLWTGDPHHKACRWVKEAEDYPCRFGYRDLSASPLGAYSHGIGSLTVGWALLDGQWAAVELGIDSERIRHALQNRLIHDGLRWPKGERGPKNPHIPMLDAHGQPYLFGEDQQIRPSRFWGALSWNPGLFY